MSQILNNYKTFDKFTFKTPFAKIIAGPSGSGKSTLAQNIVKHSNILMSPPPLTIVYAYGQYTKNVLEFQNLGAYTHHGLPSFEYLAQFKKPLLLILDDLMLYVDKKYLENLFTIKSHHENISVIFMVQNLFDKNIKTARDNSQYLILMNSPSSARQIREIGSQLFPHKLKYFMSAYEEAVYSAFPLLKANEKNRGYLLIDLHAETPEELRLLSNILPGEFTRVFTINKTT